MRFIGVGLNGVQLLCSMMDLGHSFTNYKYYDALKNIKIATKSVFDLVLEKAGLAEKEILKSKGLPED